MPNSHSCPLLLVSVRTPVEAAAALSGGADIVDAKEPARGALGAVSLPAFRRIATAVGGERPVTAALGDATDAATAQHEAAAYRAAGAAFVKLGFAGVPSRDGILALLTAAARGATPGRVVAVAYADFDRAGTPPPEVILEIACDVRVGGMLLDTADKSGPGMTQLLALERLAFLADAAHRHGLLLALAGRLRPEDLPDLRRSGADIIGVRGAACDTGRLGTVTAERVHQLRALCRPPADLRPAPARLTVPRV